MITAREYLATASPTKEMISRFLDPSRNNFARYDSELGYVISNYVVKDGVDGSYTTCRIGPVGERFSPAAAGRPCRINSYGDSFTQCHQVTDGETWQEYLGAHLGEPIRNFGCGGFGVYQAYRRMVREESSSHGAPVILFNLYEDDHRRSVMSYRWIDGWEGSDGLNARERLVAASGDEFFLFQGVPWDHLAWDLARGEFTERRALCPQARDLHRLTDPDWMLAALRDDFHFNCILARKGVDGCQIDLLEAHAKAFGLRFDRATPAALSQSANSLMTHVGMHATIWIIARIRAFVAERRKQLLWILSYCGRGAFQRLQGEPCEDQLLLDHFRRFPEPLVDLRAAHERDFGQFSCGPEAYQRRYLIGHYGPLGNFFCAHAVKDALVGLLEPRPVAYRDDAGGSLAGAAATSGGHTVSGHRGG
jgi:hypothetical protein